MQNHPLTYAKFIAALHLPQMQEGVADAPASGKMKVYLIPVSGSGQQAERELCLVLFGR